MTKRWLWAGAVCQFLQPKESELLKMKEETQIFFGWIY